VSSTIESEPNFSLANTIIQTFRLQLKFYQLAVM